jgi:thioredoxin-like negative regulator of GroEL
MVLFNNGQEVDRVVGALPKAPLKQWIDSAISN